MSHHEDGSIASKIEGRLASMLEPWRSILLPFVQSSAAKGATIDPESQAVLLGPRPDMGPLAYEIRICPPASASELSQYEESLEISLPRGAKSYLQTFNGAQFFEFSVSGADPFYAGRRGPADERPLTHCVDIGTDWVIRRRRSLNAAPILGTRNVTLNEVRTYVPFENGVLAFNLNGSRADFWPDMESWLANELAAAAKFTDEWRSAMVDLLRATGGKQQESNLPGSG